MMRSRLLISSGAAAIADALPPFHASHDFDSRLTPMMWGSSPIIFLFYGRGRRVEAMPMLIYRFHLPALRFWGDELARDWRAIREHT